MHKNLTDPGVSGSIYVVHTIGVTSYHYDNQLVPTLRSENIRFTEHDQWMEGDDLLFGLMLTMTYTHMDHSYPFSTNEPLAFLSTLVHGVLLFAAMCLNCLIPQWHQQLLTGLIDLIAMEQFRSIYCSCSGHFW